MDFFDRFPCPTSPLGCMCVRSFQLNQPALLEGRAAPPPWSRYFFCFFVLWMVLWRLELIVCKNWYNKNLKEGLGGVTFCPTLACTTPAAWVPSAYNPAHCTLWPSNRFSPDVLRAVATSWTFCVKCSQVYWSPLLRLDDGIAADKRVCHGEFGGWWKESSPSILTIAGMWRCPGTRLGNPFGIPWNSVIIPILDLLDSRIFIGILFFRS